MITIKTPEDINKLREGGKRHAFILRELAKTIRSGLNVRELDELAVKLIKENGDKAAFFHYKPQGAKRPYPASICVSINDEVVHGIPNEKEKILKEGDIVSIDLGLIHRGLITDMSVTVPVGKISNELEKLISVTKRALMVGIMAAKGGKTVGDISYAIQKLAIDNDYGIVEELAGHGVGYSVHEDPYVPNHGKANSGPVLKPGMVLAIEPMFNIGTKRVVLDKDGYTVRTADGKPSAHFEHTVLITDGVVEVLTQ